MICLTTTWALDFTLDTCLDVAVGDIVFRTIIPNNSWFAIGFGTKMVNTDMIGWFVDNKVGSTRDLWSTGYGQPADDLQNDVKDDSPPTFDEVTGKMTFITRRPLDTGDASEDYLIELNSILAMSYAFKRGTGKFEMHGENDMGVWSLAIAKDGVITDGGLDVREMLRNSDYEEHGLWMWGAWFVCGLGLLITKRYVKKFWMPMHLLHVVLGGFVLIVTIIFAMKVSKGFFQDGGFHNTLGSVFLIITILGALTGSIAAGV